MTISVVLFVSIVGVLCTLSAVGHAERYIKGGGSTRSKIIVRAAIATWALLTLVVNQ